MPKTFKVKEVRTNRKHMGNIGKNVKKQKDKSAGREL